MKKLISLMLALIMVFSLATVVSAAADDYSDYTKTEAVDNALELTKTYNAKVTDTLEFTVEADSSNPDGGVAKIIVNDVEFDNSDEEKVIIGLPQFGAAGTYYFEVKEVTGTTQGVSYTDEVITVAVYVGYDHTNEAFTVVDTVIALVDGNDKSGTYENEISTTDISFKKAVEGNLADEDDVFWVRVTVSAANGLNLGSDIAFAGQEAEHVTGTSKSWEKAIKASDGEFTVTGIPVGATVTVEEISGQNGSVIEVGKTVTPSSNANSSTTGDYTLVSISNDGVVEDIKSTTDFVVTNKRDTNVATGIVTDSAPYIILIAVCAVAAVAFVLKRRNAVEF